MPIPDILKGLARGLTADVVGAPVDMATAITNLGLAGYGFVGNKLGLLKPEQMPLPIENAVGGSNWFARNTPLEDKGKPGYAAGRFTGQLAPIALQIGMAAPRMRRGQVNALIPGGDPELILSHGTSAEKLLNNKGELAREMYNPSFAVTRGDVSSFNQSATVIPRLGKFDPKLEKTLLSPADYYTPRYSDAAGSRVDNFKGYSLTPEEMLPIVEGRLADRFGTGFPRNGFWKEGASPLIRALRRYREGGPEFIPRAMDPPTSDAHKFSVWERPRFQSFEHFERSPYGARLIVPEAESSYQTGRLKERAQDLFSGLVWADGGPLLSAYGKNPLKSLRQIASGFADPQVRSAVGRKFDLRDRTPIGQIGRGTSYEDFQPLSPAELRALQTSAREIMSGFKKVPSNYGELKAYGPSGINADRTAGIMYNPNLNGEEAVAALKKSGERRGIPIVERPFQPNERLALATDLQKRAETPRIFTGLAGKPPVTSLTEGPVDFSAMSKAELSKINPNKLNAEQHFAFTKAMDALEYPKAKPASVFSGGLVKPTTPDFSKMTLPELKAMNTGPLSHDEFKGWVKAVNQLEGQTPPPMLMKKGSNAPGWLAEADYLPESELPKLKFMWKNDPQALDYLKSYENAVELHGGDHLHHVPGAWLSVIKKHFEKQ